MVNIHLGTHQNQIRDSMYVAAKPPEVESGNGYGARPRLERAFPFELPDRGLGSQSKQDGEENGRHLSRETEVEDLRGKAPLSHYKARHLRQRKSWEDALQCFPSELGQAWLGWQGELLFGSLREPLSASSRPWKTYCQSCPSSVIWFNLSQDLGSWMARYTPLMASRHRKHIYIKALEIYKFSFCTW